MPSLPLTPMFPQGRPSVLPTITIKNAAQPVPSGTGRFRLGRRSRYLALFAFFALGIHALLTATHDPYAKATSDSFSQLKSTFGSPFDRPAEVPTEEIVLHPYRENATLLMLARNSDLKGVLQSVRELEDRWNNRYHYPWVFLNEEPFTEEFKTRVSILTTSEVTFGLIPPEHWYQPDWIDEAKAKKSRDSLVRQKVIYGGSVSYRNMCRFNSGFFFHHELLQQYKWYWRVEPDVHFACDINHDVFSYMQNHNKTYGWTISMHEFEKTIPTLWDAVKEFTKENPQHVAQGNAMHFLSDDGGKNYNLCHFWSNFEIADMDFWRGEAYSAFFEHLDSKGGFYYERWGDAPVHSIAAGLLLPKERLHFFDEIGYFHDPAQHCPRDRNVWSAGRCSCSPEDTYDFDKGSCMAKWDRFW